MQDLAAIIDRVRENPRLLNQYGYLSTSEWLIVCLGVGTKHSIAKLADGRFQTIPEAWQRIGAEGQAIVTEAWERA